MAEIESKTEIRAFLLLLRILSNDEGDPKDDVYEKRHLYFTIVFGSYLHLFSTSITFLLSQCSILKYNTKIILRISRSPKYTEHGYFTLLCRGRLRN